MIKVVPAVAIHEGVLKPPELTIFLISEWSPK